MELVIVNAKRFEEHVEMYLRTSKKIPTGYLPSESKSKGETTMKVYVRSFNQFHRYVNDIVDEKARWSDFVESGVLPIANSYRVKFWLKNNPDVSATVFVYLEYFKFAKGKLNLEDIAIDLYRVRVSVLTSCGTMEDVGDATTRLYFNDGVVKFAVACRDKFSTHVYAESYVIEGMVGGHVLVEDVGVNYVI